MSLKPPKKTDLAKSWMRRRQPGSVQINPEYHLIITEGSQTEPLYFKAIRDVINSRHKGRIRLDIHGTGMNTTALVERAVKLVNESLNPYKHVWIVYDTDDFPRESVDKVVKLCRELSTSDISYHAIWSNQCIELWFLLHYSYMHSDISRKLYYPKLSEHLNAEGFGLYRKNRKDMFDILRPHLQTAIQNAKRLNEQNHMKLPSAAAPGTKAYELLEKLESYL